MDGRKFGLRDLMKKLLRIEDTPERTALAYSIGVFLGFSPFLGFHTLSGIAIAFLFKLNRVAVLLGVWSNTPWWLVPYYAVATWLGIQMLGGRIDLESFNGLFRSGKEGGFLCKGFWNWLGGQGDLLLSFMIGSMVLAALLGLVTFPLSLRWIRFYRSRRKQ